MASEKPEECECCCFETAELKPYPMRRNFPQRTDEDKWLCILCASTMAGNAFEYPEQFREGRNGDVMKTICYVGNAIIAAIKSSQASGEVEHG